MKIEIQYQTSNGFENLSVQDQELVQKAKEAALHLSYAPYSKFQVGAALLLENGEIIQGSNQENAASPAGICAERTALSVASTLFPTVKIKSIAIFYFQPLEDQQADRVLSPCGICRQSLLEVSHRQETGIQILMTSPREKVIHLENIQDLLPFGFDSDFL